MNKRALVIRAAGDADFAAALANGIAEGAARQALRQTQEERDLLKLGYENALRQAIEGARAKYRFTSPGPVRRTLEIAWTLILVGLAALTYRKEDT